MKGVIEMNEKFANIIAEVELFLNNGKIDGAKQGLIMAAQNIGSQLANMLDVLEMMVKVQAKEGLYWSLQAQNYANFILDTVEKDKDLEYSYFEFRVALIHAMALVKKPVSDDEFERSDHLMEIIKLQDEYLNYATEYFESDEYFFEAFMASNLLFLSVYKAEELQNLTHQMSLVNFSTLRFEAEQTLVRLDALSEECATIDALSGYDLDYDELEESLVDQTIVLELLEHDSFEMEKQDFYSKLNFLVISAQVDFGEVARRLSSELFLGYNLEEDGYDYSDLVKKLGLGRKGYERAKALGLLADFPFI